MPLTPGSNFGVYRIIEPLGHGGMAAVHKAYEAALDRYVALKVLPSEFMHDTSFAQRFEHEARVIAKLEHRHIVPIYSFGIDEGIPWMAMRLVPGGTLKALLKQGRLSRSRILAILKESAQALDYAHAQGVLHRDVKPPNILLDDQGQVYLADFGIAKMIESSTIMTASGVITGTPQYMSPEQWRGENIDHRTDIYALGVVAFEMLTGRVPFSADTPAAMMTKHLLDPIPIPSASDVPAPLVRPLLKCLDKNPAARWPSASAFVRALELGLSEVAEPAIEPTGASPATVTLSDSARGGDSTVTVSTTESLPIVVDKATSQKRSLGSWALGLAVVAAALTLWATISNGLQSRVCALNASVSDVCGSLGLGNQPTKLERLAWQARARGSCSALRAHIERFPEGAYRATAADMLAARRLSLSEVWNPSERRLALFVGAEATPAANEALAKAASLARGQASAERLCKGFAATTSFRLNSAKSEPQDWECLTVAGGVACGFQGEAVCAVQELSNQENETCG